VYMCIKDSKRVYVCVCLRCARGSPLNWPSAAAALQL